MSTEKRANNSKKSSVKSKPKQKGKYIEKGIRSKPVPKRSSEK